MKLKHLFRTVRFSFNLSNAFHFFFFLSHLLSFEYTYISLRLDMPHYWADTNLNTLLATLSEQDCKLKNNHGGFHRIEMEFNKINFNKIKQIKIKRNFGQ